MISEISLPLPAHGGLAVREGDVVVLAFGADVDTGAKEFLRPLLIDALDADSQASGAFVTYPVIPEPRRAN